MRRILFVLLILIPMLLLSACDPSNSQRENTTTKPQTNPSEPTVTTEPTTTTEHTTSDPLIGIWHYTHNNKDAYIQFNSDGTGLIRYYQYYGPSGGNLNNYINHFIRWGRSDDNSSVSITIQRALIKDTTFSYLISEQTETTLVLATDGAYDPEVPTSKVLTKE